MPRPDPRLLALVDAHAAGRGTIADRVFAALYALWAPFDGWYRPSLVQDVSEQAAAVVSAGQAGTAGLADSYLAASTTLVRGAATAPAGVSPAMREPLRHGVTGPEVQARVAQEFRWQIFRGLDPDSALGVAMNRARESASQDLNLAFQRQVADFTRKRQVQRFRRVTRGEKACGLCVAASNRVYTRGDLMPMHSRCRCSVIEVGSVLGGGRIVSDEEYLALAGASRSLSSSDLKDVRYVVDEHGELGPVLRNATQRVSGVDSRGRVEGKSPAPPQAKRLDPAHGLNGLSTSELARKEAIAQKSLAFARDNDLSPSLIEWHSDRLRLIQDRIRKIAA